MKPLGWRRLEVFLQVRIAAETTVQGTSLVTILSGAHEQEPLNSLAHNIINIRQYSIQGISYPKGYTNLSTYIYIPSTSINFIFIQLNC